MALKKTLGFAGMEKKYVSRGNHSVLTLFTVNLRFATILTMIAMETLMKNSTGLAKLTVVKGWKHAIRDTGLTVMHLHPL